MGLRPTPDNESRAQEPRNGECPTSKKKSKLTVLSPRDFRGSRRRRGISHCLEDTQSKIPRFARNDSVGRVITQTP